MHSITRQRSAAGTATVGLQTFVVIVRHACWVASERHQLHILAGRVLVGTALPAYLFHLSLAHELNRSWQLNPVFWPLDGRFGHLDSHRPREPDRLTDENRANEDFLLMGYLHCFVCVSGRCQNVVLS